MDGSQEIEPTSQNLKRMKENLQSIENKVQLMHQTKKQIQINII